MEFSAKQIAEIVGGEIDGDPNIKVNDFAKIEEGTQGKLSFLANPKYEQYIYTTQSSIVLVNKTFVPSSKVSATLIKVDDAYATIAQLLQMVESARPAKKGISFEASIADDAKYGADCYVGPFAVVDNGVVMGNNCQVYPNAYLGENVTLGNNVIIYPGATVYKECVIGDNAILHAGCVIGADGFGFAPKGDGYDKIPQLGNVVIEANVEIGANTTIDRATMGSTIIRKGAKIDNLVQLGHNVEIGENSAMAAQTGISGSTKVGRNCVFGGQVGLAGHLQIGDRVQIAAQSGIHTNIAEGQAVFGSPAVPVRQAARMLGYYRRLPEMNASIVELKKEIEALKRALKQ